MEVKKAKREKLKVPIMITGASGSGKTVSALLIAKGIVEKMYPDLSDEEQWLKIGVIDTEHKRALLYAESTVAGVYIGEFLHLDFEPPYTVNNYIQAFRLMKDEGIEVVIIDSISHAWSGEGGILEQVESFTKGNSSKNMQAWAKVKPLEKEFLKLVTGNSVYVIATSRSKQAYDFDKDEKGKTKIVKMGLKPDQKDALEYEFAIALRMDQDHIAEATKDNSNMFDLPFNVSLETGKKIFDWSDQGVDLEKQRRELVMDIIGMSEESPAKKSVFDEMMGKVNGKRIDDLPIKSLKNLKGILERTEEPEIDDPKEDEDVQQEELFDKNKPPVKE